MNRAAASHEVYLRSIEQPVRGTVGCPKWPTTSRSIYRALRQGHALRLSVFVMHLVRDRQPAALHSDRKRCLDLSRTYGFSANDTELSSPFWRLRPQS